MCKKKLVSEFFFGETKLCQKKICVKKIWAGNFVGSKKVWKFILGKKKLCRKFVLAKFYFGLIRFDFVVLLTTADLNNNNTEFHWWWWCRGWINTHNLVKPTSTWLCLSWVLTITLLAPCRETRHFHGTAEAACLENLAFYEIICFLFPSQWHYKTKKLSFFVFFTIVQFCFQLWTSGLIFNMIEDNVPWPIGIVQIQ